MAIKVLRPGSGHLADAELWQREVRRLASLHHPGIVTVHDIGVHQGQMYIVSDYVEGPDLHSLELPDHRASWSESARIAARVSDALSHAHARRVVHRDVKPANIILAAGQTPVLVDFGLALSEADAGGGDRISSLAPRITCRRNKPEVWRIASTVARISTAWVWCCMSY